MTAALTLAVAIINLIVLLRHRRRARQEHLLVLRHLRSYLLALTLSAAQP